MAITKTTEELLSELLRIYTSDYLYDLYRNWSLSDEWKIAIATEYQRKNGSSIEDHKPC